MQVQNRPVQHEPPPSIAMQVREQTKAYQYHPAVFHQGESLSLSRHAQYQGAKNLPSLGKRLKQKISGLGNFALTSHYMDLKSKASHQNVFNEISQFDALKKPSFSVIRQFALDSAIKHNPTLPPSKQVAIAYESLLVYSLENGFNDPQFFGGQKDKILHFLASGALSAQIYDPDLPEIIRGGLSSKVTYGLGVLKEVFGPPFDRKDINANKAGIASAQRTIQLHEAQAKVNQPAAQISFF